MLREIVEPINREAYLDDLITDIVYTDNLMEFTICLKELTNWAIKNKLDLENVAKDIFQGIEFQCTEDITDGFETRYQFMKHDKAVRMFLYLAWLSAECENQLIMGLDTILTDIEKNQKPNNSNGLETKAKPVLKRLASSTNFFEIFPQKHTMNIAFVDQAKTYYCGYLTGISPFEPDCVCHPIIVSNFTGEKAEKQTLFAFLRALGHVFLFSLTGSHERVPEDFCKMLTDSGISLQDAPREAFAECFAVSLCMESEFAQYAPYPDIPLTVKNKIYGYITHLLTNYPFKKTYQINGINSFLS